MIKNIGRLDQVLRTGIAIGMVYLGFIDRSILNDAFSSNIIGTLGVFGLIVALLRNCPLYTLTGINTCPFKDKNQDKKD